MMPVDRYLVFYIPQEDKQSVTVLRVMFGGRNIPAQLKETAEPTEDQEESSPSGANQS